MIASNLDIREFLSKVNASDHHDFLFALEREATEAERLSYRPGIADTRRGFARFYSKGLKDLMFTVRYNARPSGLTKEEFISLMKMGNSVLDKEGRSHKTADSSFQLYPKGLPSTSRSVPTGS